MDHDYGVDSIRFAMLQRSTKIIKDLHKVHVQMLLPSTPDYETCLGHGGLDAPDNHTLSLWKFEEELWWITDERSGPGRDWTCSYVFNTLLRLTWDVLSLNHCHALLLPIRQHQSAFGLKEAELIQHLLDAGRKSTRASNCACLDVKDLYTVVNSSSKHVKTHNMIDHI